MRRWLIPSTILVVLACIVALCCRDAGCAMYDRARSWLCDGEHDTVAVLAIEVWWHVDVFDASGQPAPGGAVICQRDDGSGWAYYQRWPNAGGYVHVKVTQPGRYRLCLEAPGGWMVTGSGCTVGVDVVAGSEPPHATFFVAPGPTATPTATRTPRPSATARPTPTSTVAGKSTPTPEPPPATWAITDDKVPAAHQQAMIEVVETSVAQYGSRLWLAAQGDGAFWPVTPLIGVEVDGVHYVMLAVARVDPNTLEARRWVYCSRDWDTVQRFAAQPEYGE